ncbi:MAG: hypothetical protein LBB26_04235 [Puniceicoccales bacterium]|jgi:hypothetical protein|nr:hypothetical protein [Puniceicoccales bacterium]
MKNATTPMTDIFDDVLELQMFPVPGLTPGLKLKLPFLWKFFASLGRASPLPTANTIWKISPQIKKQTSTSDRKIHGNQIKKLITNYYPYKQPEDDNGTEQSRLKRQGSQRYLDTYRRCEFDPLRVSSPLVEEAAKPDPEQTRAELEASAVLYAKRVTAFNVLTYVVVAVIGILGTFWLIAYFVPALIAGVPVLVSLCVAMRWLGPLLCAMFFASAMLAQSFTILHERKSEELAALKKPE